MRKLLHTEQYRGYTIEILARYESDSYEWGTGFTDVVKLSYYVYENSMVVKRLEYWDTVERPKPKRHYIFWKKEPEKTFKELVTEEIDYLISVLRREVDKKINDGMITDGLMDSLDLI